jgi:hypothetical protein
MTSGGQCRRRVVLCCGVEGRKRLGEGRKGEGRAGDLKWFVTDTSAKSAEASTSGFASARLTRSSFTRH